MAQLPVVPGIEVAPIPAFQDNYIWCLRREGYAVVVDPGDARPVLEYLDAEGLTLAAVLCTHHHADHVGGVAALLERFRVPVYGPARENISTLTTRLQQGDRVRIDELNVEFDVLDIPGHTAGHIAYYGGKLLFCGDTLFACGCGRLFEGTAAQMWASLSKLAALPGDTAVYCGHEYTLSNLRFARAADPDNPTLAAWEREAVEQRERYVPTLPSTLARERAANPFLRADEPALAASASRHAGKPLHDPVQVFAALREWKNRF
jgi:hydroxyacylglutathione hydrolase